MKFDMYDKRLFNNRGKIKKLVKLKKKGVNFADKIDVPFERLAEYKKIIKKDLANAEDDVEIFTDFKEFQYRTKQEQKHPEKYKDLPRSKFKDLTGTNQIGEAITALANDESLDDFYKKNSITLNQQLFVSHYIASGNQMESARLAGYTTPKQAGHKLIRKPKIQKAIAYALSKPLDRFNITPEKIIQDLVTLKERSMEGHPVKDRHGNYVGEWACNTKDALKALEMMGNYLGMFKNTMMHVGHDGGAIKHKHEVKYDLSSLSNEELKYYEERILPKIKSIEVVNE